MADIIPFKPKKSRNKLEQQAVKLLKISDNIDNIIVQAVEVDQVNVQDVAALLAHRLGTLMKHVDADNREKLWDIVKQVVKRQAELNKSS